MTPLATILQTWAAAIQTALPEVTRCYFQAFDRRTATDNLDLTQNGSDQPEMPYIEILSWDPTNAPQGMSGLEMETHRVVVTGSWKRDTTTPDRSISAQEMGIKAAAVRKAINARMLAHNQRSATIDDVGMTTLITWTNHIRPATDDMSDVDEFAIEAAFTHFPIPEA